MNRTARLGDLIAAIFDEAARQSTNPREVRCLATQAAQHLMRRPRATASLGLPPGTLAGIGAMAQR